MATDKERVLQGRLCIHNDQGGNMRIQIEDENSRHQFIDLKISYAELMRALTGLSDRPCTFTVGDLSRVGKDIHQEEIIVLVGKDRGIGYAEREPLAIKAVEKAVKLKRKETGKPWVASHYFGSKDSFFTRGDFTYAKTHIYYWE